MTEKNLEKRSGEGNVDSELRVYLEEDGDSSARRSRIGTSGPLPMLHRE